MSTPKEITIDGTVYLPQVEKIVKKHDLPYVIMRCNNAGGSCWLLEI